ncbi:NADP-dependent oxidoreductase [Staphylococcus sp. IVB6181]|uniref:NADP-dependent oxidoreductase n=1 Tax=Staphylococcus sp. IVB6181 TaxID=2929481 RepID=UPI0021D0DA32|nr:NADP-dependent oxidoreductase [Staphylococcus sp. IVB6181]UXV35710.1 NADP-dependent oxidoreductase [Staphylococcus sp. IVB6181]
MENEQIVFAQFPDGLPDEQTFRYEAAEIKEPKQGEVLLETAYLSIDPYFRNGMIKGASYVTEFKLDQPIWGRGIAKVIKSNDDAVKEGDVVRGVMEWRRYNTMAVKDLEVLNVNDEIPVHWYLGALGVTGQTAYHGLLKIGQPKADETVVVSAASGAVGSVVGQIAKIKGSYVVGIAGGKAKTQYLIDELGFDDAVDYQKSNYADALAKAVPNGVDVYFENVGGTVANEVFKNLNAFARIPVCGSISNYNDKETAYEPAVQPMLIKNQALMQGFLSTQFKDDFEDAENELAQWIKDGKIKTKTALVKGFGKIPSAFQSLFTGKEIGKQIVQVSSVLD